MMSVTRRHTSQVAEEPRGQGVRGAGTRKSYRHATDVEASSVAACSPQTLLLGVPFMTADTPHPDALVHGPRPASSTAARALMDLANRCAAGA